MKIGDRVFVLSNLEVEEWEIYEIADQGLYKGPWLKRDGRMGASERHFSKLYTTLEEAVAASHAARERNIKRCAREMVKLATNTTVKVRLLKKPKVTA